MADPFVAEIRIFPFNFAPKGWAFCNGQLLPISQNTALFALPDMQGNVPVHPGQGSGLSLYDLGQQGGAQFVTLLQSEMPIHTHQYGATEEAANENNPGTHAPAAGVGMYATMNVPLTPMAPQMLAIAGGSLP